ncbi:MAG: hypothetical protein M3379_19915 [Acidobacteriota bacterium]|nr:hypothetical protein [Acidobacteriota bacterium]
MPRIHLIERGGHFNPIKGNVFESWCWEVTPQTAQALVGGDIYFHKKQKEPSYYGGKILGYRIHDSNEGFAPNCSGRVIFTFEYSRGHKNVSAGKGGWSQEKKIVLDDTAT